MLIRLILVDLLRTPILSGPAPAIEMSRRRRLPFDAPPFYDRGTANSTLLPDIP
jgi:hypothetical protein